MKPGLGSSARAGRGLGVLGTTSFFQHLPSPAPRRGGTQRPPGTSPGPPELRYPGASRPVPAPSSPPSFAFAVPTRNWGLAPGVVLRLGVPSAPGVTPGGGCAGSPGFGCPRTLPRVAAPPPRLPQGPGVPVRGHHPGLSSESHGRNPGLWDRPVASSLAPGLSGQRLSLAKTPQTPHQRLGGSWATPSPLRPQVLGVACHPH